MSIEIKQHLRLSQQLVMTPQLQQAIKLLQLSSMELCDMVRDEMLENPILEDSVESSNEQAKAAEQAVPAFDWETYLDNQAQAAPMPSYKSNNEDLPSLESTLTRGTSLFDHLEWQLKLSHFTLEQDGIAMLIIGNLTPDGYLQEPLEELAEEAEVSVELAEGVLRKIQEFDP